MKLRKRQGLPARDFATLTNEELGDIVAATNKLMWRHKLATKELARRPVAKPRRYKEAPSKTAKKLAADPPPRFEV